MSDSKKQDALMLARHIFDQIKRNSQQNGKLPEFYPPLETIPGPHTFRKLIQQMEIVLEEAGAKRDSDGLLDLQILDPSSTPQQINDILETALELDPAPPAWHYRGTHQ